MHGAWLLGLEIPLLNQPYIHPGPPPCQWRCAEIQRLGRSRPGSTHKPVVSSRSSGTKSLLTSITVVQHSTGYNSCRSCKQSTMGIPKHSAAKWTPVRHPRQLVEEIPSRITPWQTVYHKSMVLALCALNVEYHKKGIFECLMFWKGRSAIEYPIPFCSTCTKLIGPDSPHFRHHAHFSCKELWRIFGSCLMLSRMRQKL